MSESALKSDMKELTKSYYDALKRIKELNEENTKLKEKVIILDKIAKHYMISLIMIQLFHADLLIEENV